MSSNPSHKPDKESAARDRKGCLIMLLKFALFVIGVFVVEYILRILVNFLGGNDPVVASLIPYQNYYFSFTPYFMVIEDLNNEYSGSNLSAIRFLISLLIGYPIYGVILIVVSYIKAIKQYEKLVTGVFFYLIMAVCFYVAFFIPKKKTVFDNSKKEVQITSRRMFIIPTTVTLPYNSIYDVRHEYTKDYDLSDRTTYVYLKYYIVVDGVKHVLGDRRVDGYSEDIEWKPKSWMEKEAAEVEGTLEKLVGEKSK